MVPWSRKTVCPFCFRRFDLAEAGHRDTSPTGLKEKDEHIGKFLSITPAPEMGKVSPGLQGRFFSRLFGRISDSTANRDQKKVCPRCHMFLPYASASGQLCSDIVAIIGARGSGKSNYFGVLLDALKTRYADELNFTIYGQETFSVKAMRPVSSEQLYRERYGNRLFNNNTRMAIEQNLSAQQDRDLRIPLIYRLEFPKRPIHYLTKPFARVTAMDLVIFDAAGEDMVDSIALDQFYRYLLGAAGIVFIIDPFQFPGVRSQLSPEIRKRFGQIEASPAEVVSRVINLFETRGGLRIGHKIPVPVAFAFSKCDALKGIVHPGSLIVRDSRHDGGFNVDDCVMLSEEVMECCARMGQLATD